MKYAIYLLILANSVILGWQFLHRDDQRSSAVVVTPLSPPIEPLVMLRERGQPEPAVVRPETLPPPVKPTQPEILSPNTEAQSTAAEAAAKRVTGTNADSAQTSSSPTVSENNMEEGAQTPAVGPAAVVAMPETMQQRNCQSIGPFPDRNAADAFVADLSALGHSVTVRPVQVEQPSGYWVYLPSMPHDQAQRIVRDFESKGVKDYFLGRQDFISLGVYSDKGSAEARARSITALGYAPRLEPRFLTREVYWVDLEEQHGRAVTAEQWTELLAGHEAIRRQPLTCE